MGMYKDIDPLELRNDWWSGKGWGGSSNCFEAFLPIDISHLRCIM